MKENARDLLQVYYNKHEKELKEERDTRLKEIEEHDKYLSKVKELEEKFTADLEEIQADFYATNGSELITNITEDWVLVDLYSSYFTDQRSIILEGYGARHKELSDSIKECAAHLNLVDNYEDARKILIEYNILDKKTLKIK